MLPLSIFSHSCESMSELADESIHCCVTSPPYLGLRDNSHQEQVGYDESPSEYIQRLVAIFREVKRVLRSDGTLWLNIGDAFHGDSPIRSSSVEAFDRKWNPVLSRGNGGNRRSAARIGSLKRKEQMLLPAQVALALRDDGWHVRRENIWSKPNPMTEPVTDRTTSAHESVFMLTKREDYYYDADAVRLPLAEASIAAIGKEDADLGGFELRGGNLRSVWTIPTEPHALGRYECGKGHVTMLNAHVKNRKDAPGKPDLRCPECGNWTERTSHHAIMPRELARWCILLGSSEHGACSRCGAPHSRIVEVRRPERDDAGRTRNLPEHRQGKKAPSERGWHAYYRTVGWKPSCECGVDVVPCVVLDPFMGSGTTLEVALDNGRCAVGYEINPKYLDIARFRLGLPALARGAADANGEDGAAA
jgi:DNA modification methylase